MFVAILLGFIGYSAACLGAIPLFESTSAAESTIIELSRVMASHGAFAALVAGVVLAGILACTMSTADSQLLTAASSFSDNILQDVLHVKVSARTSMTVARLTIVAVALVALVLAWNPDSSIFNVVAFAWAGFGAAFGPVMLSSLFWRRTTLWGALVGMVSGGVMVFVWKYGVRPLGGVWDMYELLPAFLVSTLCIVVVSLCDRQPERAVLDDFDSATASRS
jgi:sodium/proline symporter